MARVDKEFYRQFAPLEQAKIKLPIVFVVDMINGFVKEGALHDPAILSCAVAIQSLITDLDCRRIFIADAHPPKTREFQSYPAHCEIGTTESEVISELQPYVEEVIHKNSTNAFTAPDFQSFLAEEMDAYRDIIITGCCSDICIMQFALCWNAWLNEHNKTEHRIIVPLDSVDTYHIDGIHDAVKNNQFALENMKANGILVVSSIVR